MFVTEYCGNYTFCMSGLIITCFYEAVVFTQFFFLFESLVFWLDARCQQLSLTTYSSALCMSTVYVHCTNIYEIPDHRE